MLLLLLLLLLLSPIRSDRRVYVADLLACLLVLACLISDLRRSLILASHLISSHASGRINRYRNLIAAG